METVLRDKADVGLAFDGDADRLGAVDENGKMIFEGDMVKVDDGEHINRILSGEIGIIEYIPAKGW